MVPTRPRSKLLPSNRTAFSSVTSRAITLTTIDSIDTQSTISTCVIHTIINFWKISISIEKKTRKLHDCLNIGFLKNDDVVLAREVNTFTYQSNSILQCNQQSNRPFYRYGGHIELILFKEYYWMPTGHEHISFVFSSALRDIFS